MTDRNYQPTVSERLHNVGDTLRQSLPGRTARVASNELLRGVDNVRGLIRAMYEWMIVPELEMIESMEVCGSICLLVAKETEEAVVSAATWSKDAFQDVVTVANQNPTTEAIQILCGFWEGALRQAEEGQQKRRN